ncbi:MAG: hypothetical protein GY714_21440 [Desulfobacterales bacterium]|nr:hypothetical protein [Desulfobacterales bacterium]MCP4161143.1 hypothetical protein [Deltaproteobacteria bacterium]
MKKILIILTFIFTGCLPFGEDIETEKPTEKQVKYCRAEMFLLDSLQIEPIGLKIRGSGIDKAIWFKFKTDRNDPNNFFTKQINTSELNSTFLLHKNNIKWWSSVDRILTGGSVSLPHGKFMSVGIEKKNGSNIVYIMWNET